MSKETFQLATTLGSTKYILTVNSTAEVVKASAGDLYLLVLDNSQNSKEVFFKLWDLAVGSVTVGTDTPDMVVRAKGGEVVSVVRAPKQVFGTAITAACVTAGGTGGTSSPPNAVTAILLTT